jgi:zinc transport system ATP-binding protein
MKNVFILETVQRDIDGKWCEDMQDTQKGEWLISCQDAGLGYDNKAVMKHLDLTVREGEYICVVGENGAGKSTLIKSLLGLLRPVSGTVKINRNVGKGAVGYLPQQTQIQRNFPASVMEVVLSGFLGERGYRPFYRKKEKKMAQKQLEHLGILDLQKQCYGELSGGQQQRVLLARALCAADKILVLDEPVTGLDPMAANNLYESLEVLHREGMAIVMVTHDLASAVKYGEKILHISDDGYFFGSVAQYMDTEYASMFSLT